MDFNFRAVSKKDRIKKTLILGTPLSIVIGIIGALVIIMAEAISFSIVYYASILGIGYIVGMFIRKIGRGTTSEFLVIAAILSAISILLAMYLTYIFRGYFISIPTFFTSVLTNMPGFGGYSFVEVLFGMAVAVFQANTVQIR